MTDTLPGDQRSDLIAMQLQAALDQQAEARERERLAAKLSELEAANAELTMTEAARQAGLNLNHQTARFFLHHYTGPADPERILTDYCTKVLGKAPPIAHVRRLQRSKPQPSRARVRQWGEFT
jgi:hypothetical protein